MTDRIRARGTLPFPEAGEGVVLRFTTSDCEALQTEFGDDWYQEIIRRVDRQDVPAIKKCLTLAAKKDGKPVKMDIDALDITQMELGRAVVDTLYLAMFGRSFDEQMEFLQERARELAVLGAGGDDPGNASSPETTSPS